MAHHLPSPGTPVSEIDTPALVIDAVAFERNLETMAAITSAGGIAFRPHAKSHKSPLVAHRQLAHGAVGVCCAKLGEAEVMVSGGIPDLLITTPVVGRQKIARLVQFALNVRVGVVVDSLENLDAIAQAADATGAALDIYIEVDVGQNRCGVRGVSTALALANRVTQHERLSLRGLQGYNGTIQGTVDPHIRRDAAVRSLAILEAFAIALRRSGHDVPVLTGGGTGTVEIDIDLGGLSEVQAGSYVFMDASYCRVQWENARAIPFESSLRVLATVISRPTRDLAVLDAGWKSLSSDAGVPILVEPLADEVSFGGDEHLKLRLNADGRALRIGDQVAIVPSHCDTTVNLYDEFLVVREQRVEEVWPIAARGRTD